MTVDGKLAMANQDHLRQGKRLDFGFPQILVDNEDQLTLMVTITSEVYGTRHGIATSRRIGGTAAEREFPWEVAETSAIGRALSAMGYGLFPGSGLASAEDMLRVGTDNARANGERRVPVAGAAPVASCAERNTFELQLSRACPSAAFASAAPQARRTLCQPAWRNRARRRQRLGGAF